MKTSIKLFAAVLILASFASALAAVRYVDVNSTNATPPFINWTTAATNIQDAVDAAVAGDEILVTDGIYATGGRQGNRVVVDKPLDIRSLGGPQLTTIRGNTFQRCVSLTNGTSLSGFTMANGSADYGGGILCFGAVVSNCIVSGNSAIYTGGGVNGGKLINCTLSGNRSGRTPANGTEAGYGGGAAYCLLVQCVLTGNSAKGDFAGYGGGAYNCTLYNCTVSGNSASFNTFNQLGNEASGGGTYDCSLYNCLAYFNTAISGANYYVSALNYCSTSPLPASGSGNFTNAPAFVDQAGGNLRLQSNSPCINSGNNAYAPAGLDLDGNPRYAGGTVDIGAYELQAPVSKISYAWLQQYGLPINAATDAADQDGDSVDNYHEWLANSDPTNPFSFPPLLTLIPYGSNVILTWTTNAVGFTLQCTTNPASPMVWATNSPAPVVIGGQNVIINPVSGPQQLFRLVH